jgi:hypothetical protein
MVASIVIQVSNQCGGPEAVSYGCRKYRVDNSTLIDTLVKQIDADHGMEEGTSYMDNKILMVSVGIGDNQDDTFMIDGDRMKDRKVSDFEFSYDETIPNRIAIMTKGWKNQDAGTVVREIGITQVKQESTEDVEEWEKLGMSRAEWVSATVKQMSEDVAHVAEKYETVLKDLEDAKRDVSAKEGGSLPLEKSLPHDILTRKCFAIVKNNATGCCQTGRVTDSKA